MKKTIVYLFFTLLFVNCAGDDSMASIIEEMEDETMTSDSFLMGEFVSDAHPTSGKAKVNSDKTILTFENFKTDNGPKLLVYLATDTNSTEYINLGDLKGLEGNFTYSIPAGTDLSTYNIVNIWCVDFSVNFGYAKLK